MMQVHGLTPREQYFGYKNYSAIESGFGRLKARFLCLRKAIDINIDDFSIVSYVSIIIARLQSVNNKLINFSII